MTTHTDPDAKPRAPLSRERVLHAAMVLADQEGLDSLTMRRLGQKLGVEAMSLYNHVANKDDLLDGMVDIAFSEIDLSSNGADWKAIMRRRAMSAREMLAAPPLGGRVDGVAGHGRSCELATPRFGDRKPAKGRFFDRDGRARLLGHGQLHLWLCAAADEHAGRCPQAGLRRRPRHFSVGSVPTSTPISPRWSSSTP